MTRGTSAQLPRPIVIIMMGFIVWPRNGKPPAAVKAQKAIAHLSVCHRAQSQTFIFSLIRIPSFSASKGLRSLKSTVPSLQRSLPPRRG